MKLTEISVTGLYGTFNHHVVLNPDNAITLLLGQNGLGKTIILKMVKSFFDKNFLDFKDYYFDKFTLQFYKGARIEIVRKITNEIPEITIERFLNKGRIGKYTFSHELISETKRIRSFKQHYQRSFYFDSDVINSELEFYINKFIPEPFTQIEPDLWMSKINRRAFSTSELLSKYRQYFPREILENFQLPPWLIEVIDETRVKFIETQRLLTKIKADEDYKSAVVKYSQEIIERIKTKRAEASGLASRLDRTYPKRLAERIEQSSNTSNDQILQSLSSLEKKRTFLSSIGLIDTDEEYVQPFIQKFYGQTQELLKEVLTVYIEDSNSKLEIYDDLSKRIKLFLDIINKRFLYKEFKIDKKSGFYFSSNVNGKEIPVNGLSSGEQHELVLFYQLLFNTQPGSLLLIDEPEISLHISWQTQFINDLMEVTNLNPFNVIIATHSPDIINNRWDLTIELKGSNEN